MGRRTVHELVDYAMRMAAVFTLATSTILLRSHLAPSWLVVAGSTTGLLLLVAVGFLSWVELLFPAWVLALGLYVLIASFRRDREEAPSVVPG